MNNKFILGFAFIFFIFVGIVSAGSFSATGSSARFVSTQSYPSLNNLYSSSEINTYWPVIGSDEVCRSREDILLQIAPAGCQPTVVRSDILGDQNVPVLCQIQAFQINPLIDIKSIDSMTFSGKYPKEVSTVGYYPAKAALSTGSSLSNSALINNVGYMVVVLKKQQNESALPEYVNLNLTATLRYDSYNALGIGQAYFILEEQTESNFKNSSQKNTFWQGRYSIKADSIEPESASISIYYQDRKITTMRVERGKQSSEIYIPGFSTCQASLRIAYDGYDNSGSNRARIEVQQGNKKTDVFDVYNGMSFANGKCKVSGKVVVNDDGITGSVPISCSGGKSVLSLSPSSTAGETFVDESELGENEKAHLKYLRNAISEYKSVAENYPLESTSISGTEKAETVYYGENSLKAAFDLIKNSGKGQYLKNEYAELIALSEEKYPSSTILEGYSESYDEISNIDSSEASSVFEMDNTYVTVRVLSFTKAQNNANAKFKINGNDVPYSQDAEKIANELLYTDKTKGYSLSVSSLNADSVTVKGVCQGYQGNTYETLREKESASICGISVRVEDINAEKLAVVRILPKVDNTQTKTNISVSVGIEKRAIQLSPEKANKVIENLNESINKFESISSTLSDTVKGLKTACFATAAFLTAKNFVTGMDGTASARKQVMQGDNGWNAKCAAAFKDQKPSTGMSGTSYVSIDDCLRQNADNINAAVKSAKQAGETVDKNLDSVTEKKETAVFGTSLDISGSNYVKTLQTNYGNENIAITDSKGNNLGTVKDLVGKIQGDEGKDAYSSNLITLEDLKKIEYNTVILKSNGKDTVIGQAANAELATIVQKYSKEMDDLSAKNSIVSELKLPASANVITLSGPSLTSNLASETTYSGTVYSAEMGWTFAPGTTAIAVNTPIQTFRLDDGKKYIATLEKLTATGNDYAPKEVFEVGNNNVITKANDDISNKIRSALPRLTKLDAADYINKYSNAVVKFFDSGSSKGMPSVIPVDEEKGWYAGVQQYLPTTTSGQSSYQSSGQVSSFFVCNVFKNGLEEFDKSGFGDDKCTQINLYTGQAITVGGLSASESKKLVSDAQQAILQAAKQYSSGVKEVKINGKSYKVENQVSVPTVRCQDYMSPRECLTLYNLCDPVICPTSRCNFGGQYYVSDVAASGIAGSALLCLPNAKEGVLLPVCLTGLSAGIDSYVSVLKTYRDCLQENVETGKTIGICDEIYSIYMCDFFWKQAIPITKAVLPKILSSAYGDQKQGGGEYFDVMGAWQSTQESISFFTQTYAVNSLKAFRARSVDEVGTDFCKAFASIKAPTAFDSLVETDSPPQFSAWFSSSKYSDATVPATAQYKVFYHIFAGKDTGISYQVYLKNPTTVSVVSIPQSLIIASGYITRGEYSTETKDFTAPEGYRELCVNINGNEECGFGQVSTSFAIDYLTDQARANTITQSGITSAASCISGSIGSGVSATLNLQSAVESTIDPEIYKQGIIRICATDNPGSTSAPGRYIDVGYCGDEKTRCWLDSESTARAITTGNEGTTNEVTKTLEQLEQDNKNQLISENVILSSDQFKGEYKAIKENIEKFKSSTNTKTLNDIVSESNAVVSQIENTEKKSSTAKEKAQLSESKAEVYSETANKIKSVLTKKDNKNTNPNSAQAEQQKITLDEALIQVNTLSGRYSANKQFVDLVYANKILTREEYNEIDGLLGFNEEDMFYVHMVLAKKKALELYNRRAEQGLITFKKANDNLNKVAFYSDANTGNQLYLAGLPMPIYAGKYTPSGQSTQSFKLFIPSKNFGTPLEIGRVEESNTRFAIVVNIESKSDKFIGASLFEIINGKSVSVDSTTPETTQSQILPTSQDSDNDLPPLSEEDILAEQEALKELDEIKRATLALSADVIGKKQFPENLRFPSRIITYSVNEFCSSVENNAIVTALTTISTNVPQILFSLSNSDSANIIFSCSNSEPPVQDYVLVKGKVLGETTSPLSTLSGKYNVILYPVSIKLYYSKSASSCNWNDVVLHETLHALGFPHNDDPESVMYYAADLYKDFCGSGSIDKYIVDALGEVYSVETVSLSN